jgi:hemerythrin
MRSRNTNYRWTLPIGGVLTAILAIVLAGCAGQAVDQTSRAEQNSTANKVSKPADKNPPAALGIPASIAAEHRELHEMLAKVIGSGGKTGEAAKEVEHRLSGHFEKEEEYALPQLGLLRQLAAGGDASDSRRAIELSDKLKADLPKMLEEHKSIVEALNVLSDAARSENKAEGQEFVTRLKGHAENEEEVMYPAAMLVGEYLKLRSKT